jgi:hypothetical protein
MTGVSNPSTHIFLLIAKIWARLNLNPDVGPGVRQPALDGLGPFRRYAAKFKVEVKSTAILLRSLLFVLLFFHYEKVAEHAFDYVRRLCGICRRL